MSAITKTPFRLFEQFETHPKTRVIRRRSLKYDINALADFEQLTGMGFGQLMQQKAIFATARALLWAGLKHEQRTLTVEEVGNLLGQFVRNGGTIDEALGQAFKAAAEQGAFGEMPDVDDVPEETSGEDEATSPALAPGSNGSESPSPSPTEN